ncbi:hypothetical protein PLESTB_000515300 [Pleodorina starrii]|uniref:THUMP domain-containing protein n=1 Tax=Pleodorina starrii TaxID=330485 RepID=A0A9W6BG58_9CHLO|nr:hypothetical protein PLESTM_000378200 [Pleodorina starrii]GLC51557.1 hypothetical protein PLESTB_000515300 [Pleodorina starrii]GLC72323.1 hypothetical protein PLESTF_001235300 [Pleodorina starrii]
MEPTATDAGADALARLRREAEIEMRRVLDESRPRKRPRAAGDDDAPFVPVDRYRYAVIQELEAGAKGFIVTCNFRREKSATREASQLLRRYMPAHLFPPQPPPPVGPPGVQPERGAEPSEPGQGGSSTQATGEVGAGDSGGKAAAAAAAAAAVSAGQAEDGGKRRRGAATDDGRDGGDSDSSEDGDDGEDGGVVGGGAGGGAEAAESADGPRGEPSALGLAKVGCRGVVVMRLSAAAAAEVDPVRVVESMLADLAAGALQPPKHCQRIIPMDATCALTDTGLSAAAAAAAAAHRHRHLKDKPEGDAAAATAAAVEPFTYAITYHSRATEVPTAAPVVAAAAAPGAVPAGGGARAADAATGAAQKSGDEQRQEQQQEQGKQEQGQGAAGVQGKALSERGRIMSLVAAGMTEVFGEAAKVNLKKPQVAVLVESIPIAGRQFASVTVLPQHLFVAKGKLVIKPLIRNART